MLQYSDGLSGPQTNFLDVTHIVHDSQCIQVRNYGTIL